MRTFGAYVHVPFCSSRCGYCDFNTYTASELQRDGTSVSVATYASQLVSEIELVRQIQLPEARGIDTVFFGGGTPTLLPAQDLIRILQSLDSNYGLSKVAEVTVEANPDSVDQQYLSELRAGGVSRISFGHQSSAPAVLKLLERTHTSGRTWQAIKWAKAVGFEHISVDLIYGSPNETDEDLQLTLNEVAESDVDHVSAYSLIVEPGTRLAQQVAKGVVPMPSDDVAARRYELIDSFLTERGFQWYEVSNWAKEGGECQHNLGYWHNHDWLGFGPGAHAHMNGVRSWNVKHPASWAAQLAQSTLPIAGNEQLGMEEIAREEVMLGLRLREGIPTSLLVEGVVNQLPMLVNEGLIAADQLKSERIVLTSRGRLLADGIITRLWA